MHKIDVSPILTWHSNSVQQLTLVACNKPIITSAQTPVQDRYYLHFIDGEMEAESLSDVTKVTKEVCGIAGNIILQFGC